MAELGLKLLCPLSEIIYLGNAQVIMTLSKLGLNMLQ